MSSATDTPQVGIVGTKKLPCGHKNFRLPDGPSNAGDVFERSCNVCKKTYSVEIIDSAYLTRILGRPTLTIEINRVDTLKSAFYTSRFDV